MSDIETPDTKGIDVAYVAHLARLHLEEEEIRTFQGQLDQVLDYVRKIAELDLEGIEPTSHAVSIENVFREDKSKAGLDRDTALANAPARIQDQFMVPKILE